MIVLSDITRWWEVIIFVQQVAVDFQYWWRHVSGGRHGGFRVHCFSFDRRRCFSKIFCSVGRSICPLSSPHNVGFKVEAAASRAVAIYTCHHKSTIYMLSTTSISIAEVVFASRHFNFCFVCVYFVSLFVCLCVCLFIATCVLCVGVFCVCVYSNW